MSTKKILIMGYRSVVDNLFKAIILDEIVCTIDCVYELENIEKWILENQPDLILATTFRQAHIVKMLKNNPTFENIPLIFFSGSFTHEKAVACGANAFLTKPVDITLLIEKLKEYIH